MENKRIRGDGYLERLRGDPGQLRSRRSFYRPRYAWRRSGDTGEEARLVMEQLRLVRGETNWSKGKS